MLIWKIAMISNTIRITHSSKTIILSYTSFFQQMDIGYKIYPLGDAAACIELGNQINLDINIKAIAIRDWLSGNAFEGLRDIIVAYCSVSIYYDPTDVKKKNHLSKTVFGFVSEKLAEAFHRSIPIEVINNEPIKIPVCYANDFGTDIDFVSKEKKISREEIIQLHTSKTYRVYMIGFLPGFPYLGQVDEKLNIPRKAKPITVAAGSVGLASGQTGIYPLGCPGGWQIIGRTPMKFFDAYADIPVTLHIGNEVQFYEITKDEFNTYPK